MRAASVSPCSLGSWACSHCAVQLKRVAERKPLHTKTLARCFQSLRIAVNDERRALKVRLLLGGTRYRLRCNMGGGRADFLELGVRSPGSERAVG